MSELPAGGRIIIEVGDGYIVYAEPYLDGWVTVAEVAGGQEAMRLYEDGSRTYTHRNGSQTTYYPDNRFTYDEPGESTIEGKTLFRVNDNN